MSAACPARIPSIIPLGGIKSRDQRNKTVLTRAETSRYR